MVEPEMSLSEVGWTIRELKKSVDAWTTRLDTGFVQKAVYDANRAALLANLENNRQAIEKLQEGNTWRNRAMALAWFALLSGQIGTIIQLSRR